MLTTLALCAATIMPMAQPITPVVTELDNGVHLIAIPVPDADTIGIEVFLAVGIADDPAGMPQAAHLLEHIIAVSSASPDAGKAWDGTATTGVLNAETLGSMMHYDIVVPPERLGWALDLTSQWISSLEIDEPLIDQEMPRCANEVEMIETYQPAAIGKFAFMAANQILRFHANKVELKTRPEQITAASLTRMRDAHLTPAGLTLAVAGDFDPGELIQQAQATVGRLDPKPAPTTTPINLLDLPPTIEATWDVGVDAVIVAVQPPDDPFERAVLTGWSLVAQMGLATTPTITQLGESPLAGGWSFPVGDMPMMVVAVPKPGASADELAGAMHRELLDLAGPTRRAGQASTVAAMSANTLSPPPPTVGRINRMATQSSQGSHDPIIRARARGMALLQTALTLGLAQQFKVELPAGTTQRLRDLDDQTLSTILNRTITPDRVRVLILRGHAPAKATQSRLNQPDGD